MTVKRDEICDLVSDWLKSTKFSDAWVFGSLIHRNGAQFDPHHSDIDVIARFSSAETYFGRCWSVVQAADSVGDLNLRLLQCLSRTDATRPIASIVPVSEFELAKGVHKDKAAQFFSHNEFLSITEHTIGSLGKEHTALAAPIEGALDAIRETQRARNQMLAVSPAGLKTLKAFNDEDPLPKTLVRCAAQVRWALKPDLPPSQRFDVNEGMVYVLQLLVARRHEFAEVNDLVERLVIRMGGRGESTALSPSDQILLWEILAEDAAALVSQPRPRLPVDQKRARSLKTRTRTGLPKALKNEVLRRQGFRCAFPNCRVPLGEDGIAEIAHIRSTSPAGPRYDPSLSQESADSPANLIALCPTHHRMIDASPNRYLKELPKWLRLAEKFAVTGVIGGSSLFTLLRLILDLVGK